MKSCPILKIFSVAFFAAFFIVPKISSAQVVINEIFPDPTGNNDTGKEWIELYNPTNQTIDLTDWQIGTGKYFMLPAFSMPPNSFLLVRWRADGQNTANEIFTGTQVIDANMGNSSGFVALFKSTDRNKNTIVGYLAYGKAGQTWESAATDAGIWTKGQFLPSAGENQSLGLKKDGHDANLIDDWQIFNQPTPNQSNSSLPAQPPAQTPEQQTPPVETQGETSPQVQSATSTEPAYQKYSDKILIDEFMPWPDPSADGGKEWVELVNLDTEIIDLSDWQIDDEPEESTSQKVPSGTLIEPGQLLVIELNKNIFNNDGDQVRLLWPDSQIVHSVSYQKALIGQSSARFGDGLWFWTNQPTPREQNKKSTAFSQTQTEQNNQSLQTENIPVANALAENVTEPNTTEPTQKTNLSQLTEDSPPLESSQTQSSAPGQTSIPIKAAAQETITSSNPKIFLFLAGVIVLSLLSGLGLIYLKRKTSAHSVDPVEKPKNVPF